MGQARDFQNRGACAPLVYSLSKGLFYGEGLFSFGRVVEGTSSANTNCELFSYWREVRSKFAVGHEDNLAFVAATPRPWRETTRRCRGSVAGAFPKEGQRTERGGLEPGRGRENRNGRSLQKRPPFVPPRFPFRLARREERRRRSERPFSAKGKALIMKRISSANCCYFSSSLAVSQSFLSNSHSGQEVGAVRQMEAYAHAYRFSSNVHSSFSAR